jgi:rhamnosyltransferase subunit B
MLRSIYSPPRYTPAKVALQKSRVRQSIYRSGYKYADKRIDRVLGVPTNAFRSELGLPPTDKIMGRWWLSPQSVLALWPDWFAPQQPDWPAQTQLMGFPLYDNSTQSSSDIAEEEAVLRRVLYGDHTQNDNAAKPPVLFTLGSFAVHDPEFFVKASAACQMLQRRGVFLLGSNRTGPKDLPSHMAYLDRYVPLSHLLPGVAAIVHHGGIGTASMAFAAGVPQVITPLAHDHFDNSRRIVGLGVARELRAKKVRADTLARALNELLSSSSVQVSCERVKSLVQNNQALERTCDVLEELASQTLKG